MLLPVQAHLARPLFVGASAALEPVLTREFAQASFVRGDKASGVRGLGYREIINGLLQGLPYGLLRGKLLNEKGLGLGLGDVGDSGIKVDLSVASVCTTNS